jgi:hypothetical protein
LSALYEKFPPKLWYPTLSAGRVEAFWAVHARRRVPVPENAPEILHGFLPMKRTALITLTPLIGFEANNSICRGIGAFTELSTFFRSECLN